MMDLIDRQATIDVIKKWKRYDTADGLIERINVLPSVQPDAPYTNVGDMISRQALLDMLHRECSTLVENFMKKKVNALPSAQPEIIYCKDCVCGHCEVWLCGDGSTDVYGYCGRTNLRVLPYDYCSWSERRTDGVDC